MGRIFCESSEEIIMCFKREKCLRIMIHYDRLAWFHFSWRGAGQSARRKQPMADKEIWLFNLRRNTQNLRFRNSFSKSSHNSLEVSQKCKSTVLIYTAQNWSKLTSELDSEMYCSNLSNSSIYTEKLPIVLWRIVIKKWASYSASPTLN